MIKLVLIIRRKGGTTRQQFIDHYEAVHAPLVTATFPEIVTYTRRYRSGDETLTDISTLDWDCMTESSFADRASYAAFLQKLSNAAHAGPIYADGETFMDNAATQMLVFEHA